MGSNKRIRDHSHLKNILWLSWRDIKNPDSGGAEKVAIEVASRLVRDKFKVTIFSSRFKNAKPIETIRGVKIIREGGLITCRFYAFLYYLKNKNFDLIIDEINTLPFFSNFYVKEKKVALIHQLAREFWWSETFFPLNLIGYLLEPLYLKTYRNIPIIACSNSTKKDLLKLGFKNISLYHHGLSVKPLSKLLPKKSPNILYIGRLTKPKGPQDAIAAFGTVHKKIPNSKLTIIGNGKPQFAQLLKSQVKKLGLKNYVDILGFVPDKEKINLLKKAKIVLIPSIREGWNMVPIEANAFGAIPIGYNVPGLCDSIQNGKSGMLVNSNPSSLAKETIRILNNERGRQKIAKEGLAWSKNFNWDKTYESFSQILKINDKHS